MLMKIGDVTAKYGITHRSLHYWENAGILKSSRGENDYRYYDEENTQKIRQIVVLRKLRLSIPSIQEIFSSNELSKIIAVFTDHLDETKREAGQLGALGVILRQLINMLRDRQDMDSVYSYLDANHAAETKELKEALKTVLAEPVKEIEVEALPEVVVDMTGVDLSLELLTKEDIPELIEIIKHCYPGVREMDKLLFYWDFRGFDMPGCRWFYKIMLDGECVGAVNLAYVGMEATLVRCLAYTDSDNNIYLFELLKREFPGTLCWMIRNAPDDEDFNGMEDFNYDWEGRKQRFWEDNGFVFYTKARYNQFIKMLKPHDEVYKSSKYRFALLDGSMDDVSFRFFGAARLDFYDGAMGGWRVTDCNFSESLIYDTWMGKSKFYDTGLNDSEFNYIDFGGSYFSGGSFKDCKVESCDISGLTIDGVNVKEALEEYSGRYVRAGDPFGGNPFYQNLTGPNQALFDKIHRLLSEGSLLCRMRHDAVRYRARGRDEFLFFSQNQDGSARIKVNLYHINKYAGEVGRCTPLIREGLLNNKRCTHCTECKSRTLLTLDEEDIEFCKPEWDGELLGLQFRRLAGLTEGDMDSLVNLIRCELKYYIDKESAT